YHGNACLQVKYSSAGDSYFLLQTASNITGITEGQTYTLSWYDKHNIDLDAISGSSRTDGAHLTFLDSSGNPITGGDFVLSNWGTANNTWHRHSITATAPTGATQAKISFGVDSPNFLPSNSWMLDAIQLEQKSIATSYVSTSRVNTGVSYNSSIFNPNLPVTELTIAFWIFQDDNSKQFRLWLLGPYVYGYTLFIMQLYMDYVDERGRKVSTLSYSAIPNCTWTHFCVTFSSKTLKVYINGILDKTVSVGYNLAPITGLLFLSYRNNLNLLSNFYLLPFALSASQVYGLYQQTKYTKHPYVVVEGDLTKGEQVTCLPELTDTDMIQYYDTTYGATIGRKLKF
ncbi:MAG: hypothetical protein H5U39_09735, partial [Deferribacterales bacterium]|nr:hypothetical protein [Deferribacterales bacterium]